MWVEFPAAPLARATVSFQMTQKASRPATMVLSRWFVLVDSVHDTADKINHDLTTPGRKLSGQSPVEQLVGILLRQLHGFDVS